MSESVTDPNISRDEHAGDVKAKRVQPIGWDGTSAVRMPAPFILYAYDNFTISYPDDVTEVYTFKQGVTTVQTITLTYVDSTKERLSTGVRS